MHKTLIVSLFTWFLVGVSFGFQQDFVQTIEGTSLVLKAIPGGTFGMGCSHLEEPCAEAEWFNFEAGTRQGTVEVASFYLAETETTWELYDLCIASGRCPDNVADGGDNSWGKGDRPAIEISWNDVVEGFIPWINEQTGQTYRLPTESEWEYAARAGSSSRFPWGETPDCSQARFGRVSNECGSQLSTDPVRSYPPNAFGLYDMIGNVWEMVDACWSEPRHPMVRATESACRESVLRGGSWLNGPENIRVAARFRHEKSFRESGDGFRLALDY